jgi:hypothetical protein
MLVILSRTVFIICSWHVLIQLKNDRNLSTLLKHIDKNYYFKPKLCGSGLIVKQANFEFEVFHKELNVFLLIAISLI